MMIALLVHLAVAQTETNALQQNAHLGNIAIQLEEIAKHQMPQA